MLSNKPYLLRAFYEWIVDSNCTPVLVLDALNPRCKIPKSHIEDGEIVFNISPVAVRDFKIGADLVEFRAACSGVIHLISAPVHAVLALYAEENNEGLFFDGSVEEGDGSGSIELSGDVAPQESLATPVRGKPFLTVVE